MVAHGADGRLVGDRTALVKPLHPRDASPIRTEHEAGDARRLDPILHADDRTIHEHEAVDAKGRRVRGVCNPLHGTGGEVDAQQSVRVVGEEQRSPVARGRESLQRMKQWVPCHLQRIGPGAQPKQQR